MHKYDGRHTWVCDHHNLGFTTLLAGGGIRGGLNQDALSYLHLGRRERLTQIQGEVIKGILA